jgi:cell division transport system ATP-binding protein
VLRTFHVTKVYETGDAPAIHDLSLQVAKGEFVFLTGPSGAGKTTLLKLLFAEERPTSGQVFVDDLNLAQLRPSQVPMFRRRVGVVFQDYKLIPHRTVAENVAMTLWVLGLPERTVQQRVAAMLKAVGLFHRAHVLPAKLSGGEQQRASIARALINDPVLLLADEPTGNLDTEMSMEVMALLERANTRGTTVLIATHDQALMDRAPRRTLALEAGRLVEDDRPSVRPDA